MVFFSVDSSYPLCAAVPSREKPLNLCKYARIDCETGMRVQCRLNLSSCLFFHPEVTVVHVTGWGKKKRTSFVAPCQPLKSVFA